MSRKAVLLPLLIINIVLQVSSFVLVKLAALNSQEFIGTFLNAFYLTALLFVVIRAYVWQMVLKRAELSKVYPLNAIVPVFILIFGVFFFGETATSFNILGAVMLIFGILFLVRQ